MLLKESKRESGRRYLLFGVKSYVNPLTSGSSTKVLSGSVGLGPTWIEAELTTDDDMDVEVEDKGREEEAND